MKSAALRGALWAVPLAFPLAALCAVLYRFPVPFGGYQSGVATVPHVLLAVLFYGLLGGFPALLAAGALGGVAAYVLGRPDERRVRRIGVALAALAAMLGVMFLAVLDKLIGPW